MQPEIEAVLDEVRLLFNTLVRRGDALHAREAITMGMRAVLEFLEKHGPSPVPQIARSRRVSRQHIQALVNPLLELGYLEGRQNPAHRRSPLLALTAAGQRTIRAMRRRESRFLERVEPGVRPAQLRRTAETLRALRTALER